VLYESVLRISFFLSLTLILVLLFAKLCFLFLFLVLVSHFCYDEVISCLIVYDIFHSRFLIFYLMDIAFIHEKGLL
jgi:hypothetical protein